MDQQRFWTVKEGDTIFHCSSFGDRRTETTIPAHIEQEFKIFHGTGGMSFEFSIGLMLFSDSNFLAASAPTGLDFETHAGFGWELPDSPGLHRDPSKPPEFPIGGGGGSLFFREGLTVKLFRPREDTPSHVWDFPNEQLRGERDFNFPLTTDAQGNLIFTNPELMKKFGWWRVVISHKSPNPAQICFWSKSFYSKANIKKTTLSYRWINHALETVLGLITPRASITGGNHLSAGILEEVSESLGRKPPPPVEIDLPQLELVSVSKVELAPSKVVGTRGSVMKAYLQGELDKLNQVTSSTPTASPTGSLLPPFGLPAALQSDALVRFKDFVKKRMDAIQDDDLVVKIAAVFSDPKVTVSSLNIVSVDAIFEEFPTIFLAIPNIGPPTAFANLNFSLRNVNPFEAFFLGFAPGEREIVSKINNAVTKALFQNYDQIKEYLLLVLARAAGQDVRIDRFRATSQGWELDYYDYSLPDPHRIPPLVDVSGQINPNIIGGGNAGAVLEVGTSDGGAIFTPDPAFGVFPEGFQVTDGGSLAKLDRIKTIFVIMMENRSFDHFLGFLSKEIQPAGDRYIAFPPSFTNPKAGTFSEPIPTIKAKSIFPHVLRTPVSPEHEYDHVLKQISDGFGTKAKMGAMQGFTTNILERFAESGAHAQQSPQLVMSFYEKEQLPTYFWIAEHFKVLDQWFAAHPGPTWPNRIAMVTGHLLGLRNFDLHDERIGYLKAETIFDHLTRNNIDWRYLESNVSILRLFDNFRTDDTHVVPLRENDQFTLTENHIEDHYLSGLDLLLAQSELPRVVFIDPRFSDVPPLRKAYDDLAPANIGLGQSFIRDICDRIAKSNHWSDSTLLITYDEHGGFFDHVPPPGTPFSGLPPVKKMFPDKEDGTDPSPDFLGVRVPTLLFSPYVSERSVSHTVFDHTSILKTILVHNRNKIARNTFELFSDRVKEVEHLGVALDLDTPRSPPDLSSLFDQTGLRIGPSGINSLYPTRNPFDPNDFHQALSSVFMPRGNLGKR